MASCGFGIPSIEYYPMNKSPDPVPGSNLPPVTLRPEQSADELFLMELYASTRKEELDLINWDANARAAFIKMQFKAMRRGYASMFPDGQFSIVMLRDLAIGRIVIQRGSDEIRLVDMALTPEMRCRGIGTRLLQSLQTEAQQIGKPLKLHVLIGNRAEHFYQRLGFQHAGDTSLHREMKWVPTT